jgi:ABC-2 type transport system permease protein
MTAFIALVIKDLKLFLNDKRALVLTLAMPIVLAAFFGYLFGGSGKKETSKIDIAVVQLDSSEIGAKIVKGLQDDATLDVAKLARAEAEALVRKGKRKVAIIIPAGFGDAAGAAMFGAGKKPEIELLYDPSQNAVLAMVKGMLTQHVMQNVSGAMFNGPQGRSFTDKSLAELAKSDKAEDAALREMLESVQKYQATPAAKQEGGAASAGLSNPFATRDVAMTSGRPGAENYNGYAHSFAGMGVQFILFMGIDIGVGILLARRTGIWSRLLAAPVTLNTVLLARTVSAALIAFGVMCFIFAVAVLVFGVTITNMAGFFGVTACFALLTATFGLLIAAFGKTPEAARGLSIFATLVMVMLGGAWVPSFFFPPWVQQVSLAVPTRWAIDGLDAVTWRGLGMDVIWPVMGVQLAFAAVFGVLALWKFGRDGG